MEDKLSAGRGATDKSAPLGEQASLMGGCGCLVLVAVVFGPLVTNWIGLTPWPVAVAFALAAAVAWFTSANPFPFPRAFLVLVLIVGAIGGYAIGDKVAEGDPKPTMAPAEVPAPTAQPQPGATALPLRGAPARREEVRITIDEIVDKFAKNQIAGAQFFEARTAIIPGAAVRVREVLGTGILVVRSPGTGRQMEIAFSERGTRQLGEVEPGNRFEATCPDVHEALSQIIIACSDISVVKKP